jgi:hypothetical protein
VIERVREDGVLFAEQGLEEPAVRVEARGVEDGVVRAEEARDRALELFVEILRPADEPDAREPEAVRVDRLLGRGNDRGVRGEPQVVVGAEIQDVLRRLALARARIDFRPLGRRDHAFELEQPCLAYLVQCCIIHASGSLEHAASVPLDWGLKVRIEPGFLVLEARPRSGDKRSKETVVPGDPEWSTRRW